MTEPPASGEPPPYGQPSQPNPPYGQPPQYGQPNPQYGQPNQQYPPPYQEHGQEFGQQYGQPYPPHQSPTGEPPLWMPHYGCSLPVAVKRFFKKYAKFSGRASRAEFWWLYLAYSIAWFALMILAAVAGIPGSSTAVDGTWEPGPGIIPFSIIMVLAMFGTIVPSIALTVRRLHDVGFSGLLFLITFIPYVGSLIVLIFTILPPKPEGARFDQPEYP